MKKRLFLSLFIVFNLGFSDLQSTIKNHYSNKNINQSSIGYSNTIGNYEKKMLNLKNENEEKFKVAQITKLNKDEIDELVMGLIIEWKFKKEEIYNLLNKELSDSCRLQLKQEEKIWQYKFSYDELDDIEELPIDIKLSNNSQDKLIFNKFKVRKALEERSIELARKYDYLMQLDKQQRKSVCP